MILYKSKCHQFLEVWHKKKKSNTSFHGSSIQGKRHLFTQQTCTYAWVHNTAHAELRLFCQRQIRPYERECLFYKAGTENLFFITHFPKHNRALLSLPHFWTIDQQISERSQICESAVFDTRRMQGCVVSIWNIWTTAGEHTARAKRVSLCWAHKT